MVEEEKEDCDIYFDEKGFMQTKGCPSIIEDIKENFNAAWNKIPMKMHPSIDSIAIGIPGASVTIGVGTIKMRDDIADIKEDLKAHRKEMNKFTKDFTKEIKAHRKKTET